MLFLHTHGVGTARAVRIYKSYGADAGQVMSENPYRLARDIRGIGFVTFCITPRVVARWAPVPYAPELVAGIIASPVIWRVPNKGRKSARTTKKETPPTDRQRLRVANLTLGYQKPLGIYGLLAG